MMSHAAWMLLSELEQRGGNCSKKSLRGYVVDNNLGDFDDLCEQLIEAKAIYSLYSYIAIRSLTNKNKYNKATTASSYKLIKAAAKMANVNYRAVVNGTSLRPNENQKKTQHLSRQDVGEFWIRELKK